MKDILLKGRNDRIKREVLKISKQLGLKIELDKSLKYEIPLSTKLIVIN